METKICIANLLVLITLLINNIIAINENIESSTIETLWNNSPNVSLKSYSTSGLINRNLSNQLLNIKYGDPINSNVGKFPTVFANMKLFQSNDINSSDPPPHDQIAKMARYIVSKSLWTSIATISDRSPTKGSPFASIFSISDGTLTNSTGIPYIYMTPIDHVCMDLHANPNASLVMSLAQGEYCTTKHYDPEDPRCAIVTLTGRMIKLAKGSQEQKFAKEALFQKHPAMRTWPKSHRWFCAKLQIYNILVRDYFGGVRTVPINEYFKA